jgi:uncharacterized membrane protein
LHPEYILGLRKNKLMSGQSSENESVNEEIRRGFQLERMVLFSDAVFAIVITLMAIEINIPDGMRFETNEELMHELIHLLPSVIAYTASFLYIGFTWYQHLEVFSLLKDYDKGLVFRNLLMLFFIGFFPFSASLVARPNNGIFLTILIYFSIILLSKSAQLALQHYILIQRPQLRIKTHIHKELVSYKKSRIVIVMLVMMFVLTSSTLYFVKDPALKPIAWWWFFLFPFLLRYFQKKIK